VAGFYGLDPAVLSRRGDAHIARAVAAWLCRRHTEAPLRELAARLGLSRADSVPNLTRRVEARLVVSPKLARELELITRGVGRRNQKQSLTPWLSAKSDPLAF